MRRVEPLAPEPLLRQRFTTLSRQLAGVRTGDLRAVHQARVATRRLREALNLAPAGRRGRKAREAVRVVTQALGPVREIDVMLQTLQALAASKDASPAAARALRLALQRDRRRHHRKALAAIEDLNLPRVRRRLLDFLVASTPVTGGRPQPLRRADAMAARRRMARRAEALRRAIDDAAALYVPERLHEVRIAVKKLRYALEIVVAMRTTGSGRRPAPRRPGGPRRASPDAARLIALKRAQESLGRLHDFEVLIVRIRELQGTADAPDLRVSGDLDRLVRALETECRLLHAHYMTQRAQLLAICESLGRRLPSG